MNRECVKMNKEKQDKIDEDVQFDECRKVADEVLVEDTELKTLKDFFEMKNYIEIDHYTLEEIKKEAIKWIKHYNVEAMTFQDELKQNKKNKSALIGFYCALDKIALLQKFFNIEEGDLK